MEKTTSEFTQADWLKIQREGSWFRSYDQEAYSRYLGVERENIAFTTNEVSFASALVLKFCLSSFLEQNNYEVIRTVEFSHDGEYIPAFKNIEYEPKQYRNCLNAGSQIFKHKETSNVYILSFENYQNVTSVKLASNKLAFPSGEELIKDFFEFSKKNNYLKGKKIDAGCNFIYFENKYSWDDLIVSSNLKEEIKRNLFNLIQYRDIYEKNNLAVKRGLIFHGPPGTGKSLLGKILCNNIDWTFIWVTPKYFMKTDDVAKVVEMARELSPAVIFLEDIDLFGRSRGDNPDTAILGELMNQLDGIQENKDIITIGTTNNVEVIEKALADRPGRFDKVLELGKPDQECREKMLKQFTKTLTLDEKIDLKVISDLANGLTGAHIKELVNFAILVALEDKSFHADTKLITLKAKHFKKALETVKKKDFGKLGFGSAPGVSNLSVSDEDFDFRSYR